MAETLESRNFKRVLMRNLLFPVAVGAVSALIFVAVIAYLLSTLNTVRQSQQIIGGAHALASLTSDMQSGLRGFMWTEQERYLGPYNLARPKILAHLPTLMEQVRSNREQFERLQRFQALMTQWDVHAQRLIEGRRGGATPQALAPLNLPGIGLFDQMRREVADLEQAEAAVLVTRSEEARRATYFAVGLYAALIVALSVFIAFFGRRQLLEVSGTYSQALEREQSHAAVLQHQTWLRTGQAGLSERLTGQRDLGVVGAQALSFLIDYVGAAIGGFYVRGESGTLRRVAAYGLDAGEAEGVERTLVSATATAGRIKHLHNIPADHFKVKTGLGESDPLEIALVPVTHDGEVNGVVELGFLHPIRSQDLEFLELIAGTLGATTQAAIYRSRLQETLAETQQLNEELQTQQEELRTANEELEEQARALSESQAHLEQQQAELEQTNSQLAQQADIVASRNEALKLAQVEMERRAAELQRASKYKSEFLANMSHELRTPLNSSLILAKLLAEDRSGNLNEEQRKYANTIYSAGNDLLSLINDILDLSKVEAGKMELAPQRISTDQLLDVLRAVFEPLAREKNLAFEVSRAQEVPTELYTDRQRLEQVLRNLLSNAIKFTKSGKVLLHAESRGADRIAFLVTDTGIGIPADQQQLIFEAFRQADGTIHRSYGGTGLGLSISREFAHLLGGRIEVRSVPGEGSTFALDLPVRYAGPAAAPAVVPLTAPITPQRTELAATPTVEAAPTIPDDRDALGDSTRVLLVIEDDQAFASILYDLAHETHYRCLIATTADEGLSLARKHVPRAILLDIRLPDGSGLTVLQELKHDPRTRHIPVHVLAAEDFGDVARHIGAVGFNMKPTTREALQDILKQLEEKGAGKVKRVLLVEDDERQRDSIVQLIKDEAIDITAVESGGEALEHLRHTIFDCMIIDLKLPDMEGAELLDRMTREEICSFPPVIVYTGRQLTREEEADLNRYSRSIIIKGARSPERLLDEVTLFLHTVEARLSRERQSILRDARNRDDLFEGRKVLLVDDDVRNIFALTSALEQRGMRVEIARNGIEALEKLQSTEDIELVLMDIMMPGMDGLEATRRIRANPRLRDLPVIAITAKAMRDDQDQCRRAGANDYMAKPIDLDRLLSLIRVWLPSLRRIGT